MREREREKKREKKKKNRGNEPNLDGEKRKEINRK